MQLIRINVLMRSYELVQLLSKVLASVAHVYLHPIVIKLINSEGKDEPKLLSGSELRNNFCKKLKLFRWYRVFAFVSSTLAVNNIAFYL